MSGQSIASINIGTVDDDVVEQTESLHVKIDHVITSGIISVRTTGQNSSSIRIINNDGNKCSCIFAYIKSDTFQKHI